MSVVLHREDGRVTHSTEDVIPWTRRDALGCGGLLLLGLIGVGVCWYGLSGRAAYQDQMPWLFAGILCAVVVGAGTVGWVLIGMRQVHRDARELSDALRIHALGMQPIDGDGSLLGRAALSLVLPRGSVDAEPTTDSGEDRYVLGGAMTRVHRPTCPFVRGKSIVAISASEVAERHLGLCGACCR